MSDASLTLQKIDGIYDIEAIVTPALSIMEVTVISLFFILLVTVGIYLLWRLLYSRKAIAKRKIKLLQVHYSQENLNSHDAVYQLCLILRHGLKLPHINEKIFFSKTATINNDKWKRFTQKLSNLRYENNNNESNDITPLFEESIQWLKLWS